MTETLRVVNTELEIERAGSNIISLGPTEKRLPAPTSYNTYLDMYRKHAYLRAGIDKIAKSATASGYTFLPRDSKQPLNEKSVEQLRLVFERSNANMLLRKTAVDLLIFADGFWHVEKARNGAPYMFRRSSPKYLTLIYDSAISDVSQVIVRDSNTNTEMSFPWLEWAHFMLPDPDNDIYGLSLLESLKAAVTQDLFAETYNARFFENSAQTGVIFNMKGASKEEVERNREFLSKQYVGADNAHKPLLLEGEVSVQKSVATPAEMEFIKGREFLRDEILAVLDVPLTKVGGTESANRSQSSENDKSFRAETVRPFQTIIEEVINEKIIWDFFGIEDTIFAFNEIDMRDEKDKASVDLDLMGKGVLTINKLRADRGLAPVEGGDDPFVMTASGIVPVKDIATLIENQQKQAEARIAQASVAMNPADATGQPQDQNKNTAPPVPKPPQGQNPQGG